jgi:hypothetical protein
MTQLTEKQTDFFQALCAPFPESELRHHAVRGKTLSYITNRILFNRLDDVAGPTGWYTEYRTTERGFTCRLHILVPDHEDKMVWLWKEDGGGYAGMSENDNDEKSGYSDAAKRAGMVWGIARDLYKDGVPAFMEEAQPSEPPSRLAPNNPRQSAPARQPQAPPRQSQPPRQQGQGTYDNFRVPRPGAAVYRWICFLEEHFGASVKKTANAIAKNAGYPFKSTEWNEAQLEDVAWQLIDDIKGYPGYQGEFDHLEDSRPDPR